LRHNVFRNICAAMIRAYGAAAGGSPLRLQDRLRRRPSMSEDANLCSMAAYRSQYINANRIVSAPSHGENRGSSPLGSANGIKDLFQNRQLVSNNCPINGYGQAWTSMIENRAHACARHEFPSAPRCSVVVNAAASAGSHRQAIERLPKDCAGQAVRELISDARPRRNFKAAHRRSLSHQPGG
jgi:hypothetical protein